MEYMYEIFGTHRIAAAERYPALSFLAGFAIMARRDSDKASKRPVTKLHTKEAAGQPIRPAEKEPKNMKLLITGFSPFGGETLNPAWEAVKLLPDRIGAVHVVKKELPTVFKKAGLQLWETIRTQRPDAVLCVGQAGGRSGISIERVAVNLADFPIADNEGNQPIDQPVIPDGKNAYFSTLPVKAMVQAIRAHGIPASLSHSAGTYVCNDVFYRLLYLAEREFPLMKGGFLHVPYSLEQTVHKPQGTPGMPISVISDAICFAVEALDTEMDGTTESDGAIC